MTTKLTFAKDETLTVDEDLERVEIALSEARNRTSGLAKLTKKDRTVLVNPALVRYIQDGRRGEARVVSV